MERIYTDTSIFIERTGTPECDNSYGISVLYRYKIKIITFRLARFSRNLLPFAGDAPPGRLYVFFIDIDIIKIPLRGLRASVAKHLCYLTITIGREARNTPASST